MYYLTVKISQQTTLLDVSVSSIFSQSICHLTPTLLIKFIVAHVKVFIHKIKIICILSSKVVSYLSVKFCCKYLLI